MKRNDHIRKGAMVIIAVLFFVATIIVLIMPARPQVGGSISRWKHTHRLKDHVGAIYSDLDFTLIAPGSTSTFKFFVDATTGNIFSSGSLTLNGIAVDTIYATSVYLTGNISATGSIYASGSIHAESASSTFLSIDVGGGFGSSGTTLTDSGDVVGDGYASFTQYFGDGSNLTGVVVATPTFEEVTTAGATTTLPIEYSSATVVNGIEIGGGYGATGIDLEADGEIYANGAITTDGQLTAASASITNGIEAGGGYGSTGVDIQGDGDIYTNGNLVTDGTITSASGTITANMSFGGGYGATGLGIETDGSLNANGNITTDGLLTAASSTITNGSEFGGGYGSTGLDIQSDGDLYTNGAITSDGQITAASATIGGGYGTTGITMETDGDLYTNGLITAGGAITSSGLLTAASASITNGAEFGGGYGSTGLDIEADGDLNTNGAILTDSTISAASGTITNGMEFGGGYGATGVDIAGNGNITTNGTITSDGLLTSASATFTNGAEFGGGYGSTGLDIEADGDLNTNGAIVADGGINGGSATSVFGALTVGGGYGATGLSADVNGNLYINGKLTVDGDIDPVNILYSGTITGGDFSFASGTLGGGYGSTGIDFQNDGDIYTNGNITATEYYGDGSNLTGIDLAAVLTEGNTASDTIGIDDLFVTDDVYIGDDLFMEEGHIFNICPTCTNGGFNFHTDANYLYASGPLRLGGGTAGKDSLYITKIHSGHGIYVLKTSGIGNGINVSVSSNGHGISGATTSASKAGLYGKNTGGGNALEMRTEGGTGIMIEGTSAQTSGDLINIFSKIGALVKLTFEMTHSGQIGIGHDVTTDPNYMLTASGTVSGARWERLDDGANGPASTWYHNSVSPANADIVATLNFNGEDDGSNDITIGKIQSVWTDIQNASKDSRLDWSICNENTCGVNMTLAPNGLTLDEGLFVDGGITASGTLLFYDTATSSFVIPPIALGNPSTACNLTSTASLAFCEYSLNDDAFFNFALLDEYSGGDIEIHLHLLQSADEAGNESQWEISYTCCEDGEIVGDTCESGTEVSGDVAQPGTQWEAYSADVTLFLSATAAGESCGITLDRVDIDDGAEADEPGLVVMHVHQPVYKVAQ